MRQGNACLEDVPGLSIDSDDSDEDDGICPPGPYDDFTLWRGLFGGDGHKASPLKELIFKGSFEG